MIYYYDIVIEYLKGNKPFIKTYVRDFAQICDFFIWLKKEHGNNFTILKIKEHRQYKQYRKYNNIFFEEFISNKGE